MGIASACERTLFIYAAAIILIQKRTGNRFQDIIPFFIKEKIFLNKDRRSHLKMGGYAGYISLFENRTDGFTTIRTGKAAYSRKASIAQGVKAAYSRKASIAQGIKAAYYRKASVAQGVKAAYSSKASIA